jgi:hypothetical protein
MDATKELKLIHKLPSLRVEIDPTEVSAIKN